MTKGSPRPRRAGGPPSGARVRALTRPAAAMGLLVVGLLLATAFVAIAVQRNAMAREIAALQAQTIAEQARRTALEAAVTERSSDSYVVDKAREYGFVKPGETLIGVQQEPRPAPSVAAAAAPTRAQKWITLFFGAR